MLRNVILLALVASTAFADKPASPTASKVKSVKAEKASKTKTAGEVVDLNTSESQQILSKHEDVLKKVAEDRVDTLDEKSDVVQNYEAGAPVSQGNLYYYYYPVAAYPVNGGPGASDKVSSGAASSPSDLLESPLLFILVPLLLLLLAAPLVALFINSSSTSGRSFGGARNSDLDEKFGSFAELQGAIDYQLAKYMTALDSENCMDRIVCELGVKASNIPHKNLFYSVVEWLAPEHGLLGYGRMTILKQAASGKYTMESCKKYMCNPPASIQAK